MQVITGVVPILATPFDNNGRIDEESLRNLIEFNIAAGVHGVGVANGSELYKLNEAERNTVVRCVVDAVAGRVPVVISTGAAGTDLTTQYSRAAQEAGADAIMLMPPSFMPVAMEGVVEHYRQVARSVLLPVILQDVPAAPVAPALALRIAKECDNVRYIKVETFPLTAKVGAMVAAVGDALTVFGGAAGTYFIEEMRRGSQGTMPHSSLPSTFVEVWNRVHHGDTAGARALFDQRIMPTNRLTAQNHEVQLRVHKQLLVRQGIIRNGLVRGPTAPLDSVTQSEVDELIAALVPTPKAFPGR